jgi:hypothetical protein
MLELKSVCIVRSADGKWYVRPGTSEYKALSSNDRVA